MISVKGLSHRFGDREVLKDISFEVAQGELLALMGSSGGGKTTLLRCISGLIPPTEGQVFVAGIDAVGEPERARSAMGMVFQYAALFDSMTVSENILFGIRRRRELTKKEEITLVGEALSRVGLIDAAGFMPSELSGGMRKRVGVARALALEPRVILYDEPTTGLDPITTYTIDELIVSVKEDLQVTGLLVSHDVASVMRVADRVAFLHQGGLAYLGTPEGFLESEFAPIQELVQKSRSLTLAN